MSLTKAELAEIIHQSMAGLSKKEAVDFIECLFETLKETLERGEKVKISGFGKFLIRDKRPRKGRNPQTGEDILIQDRRVLTFKPSAKLRDAVND